MTSNTPNLECLYCGRQVAASAATQYTCRQCWKTNEANFGSQWFLQPWHVELLPSARAMKSNPVGITGLSSREREAIRFVPVDAVLKVIDTDAPALEITKLSNSAARYAPAKAAVYRLYITQKLGARRVHRELAAQGITPSVSLRTVQNWLRVIRDAVNTMDGSEV